MQVGTFGGAGVPDLAEERPGLHYIADLHREAARVQMRVEREDIGGDFEHHMIAAIVFLRFRDHRLVRRLVGHAVVDRDDRAIGDREDVLSESIVLLALLPSPSKILSFLTRAQSMAKVSAVSMRSPSMAIRRSLWTLGLQQPLVTSQPFPARGGLITMAGWRLIATSGPSTWRLPTIKVSFEPAARV